MSNVDNKITIKDLEQKLWKAADTLRGNLSAEDYMHIVLGILILKFINDKNKLVIEKFIKEGLDEESIEPSDLQGEKAFVVPKEAKWDFIISRVGTVEIGEVLDNACNALGNQNSELKGLFNTLYNDPNIDKTKLGEVVKIFQGDNLAEHGEDILGRIYEYFLGEFFLKRGQKGGEFYTPKSIVKLIVNFIKPAKGKIYDPCCGTGGMLVQAKQYIESKGGNSDSITVYGQEYNSTTWKLAKLNLILNGLNITNLDNDIKYPALGEKSADTFVNDQHKGKVFDFIMANPPFNIKEYWNESLKEDSRWKYGIPPARNANYAWIQHIIYKLSTHGKAGVVLANGSLTSSTSGEDKIRESIIKDNKISCIVSLPDKLFYTTGISASIWFFDNNKKHQNILMIDAQNMGELIEGSKKNKEIPEENLKKLENIFNDFLDAKNIDIPGLAKSISLEELKNNNYSLLPGNYISIPETEKKDEATIKKELKESINQLLKLMDESKELEKEVLKAIKEIDLD